jgi:hypothetical protein
MDYSMNQGLRINSGRMLRGAAALAALLMLVVASSGCNKLKARDLLTKGVRAFKNGQTDAAIEFFKQSKEADPSLMNAQVYLATAYASLYIPGAPSAENMARGNQAIAEFKSILEKDPSNLTAIDGIGSIIFQMAGQPFDPKKFEESKSYHQKHIELRPNDPEPYYWIGVIDWTEAFRGSGEMRLAYNRDHIGKQVKETDPLPASLRPEYASKYANLVEEGINAMKKAIALKPDYDDAMAYLNLLYRRKAYDLVQSREEQASYLKQADDLLDKVKEIKQKRASQQQPS